MDFLRNSKGTTLILTGFMASIFCILIATGWKYLLDPALGDPTSLLLAVIFSIVGLIGVRQIALFKSQAIVSSANPKWHHGWAQYLFVAILSAFGTVTASFIVFESKPILRHDIGTVRTAIRSLSIISEERLPPPGYKNTLDRLESLLTSLKAEIVSPVPGYCGVGEYAIKTINKIKEILPDFRIIRGTTDKINDCKPDDLRALNIYNKYAETARDQLKNSKLFAADRGTERIKFLDVVRTKSRATADKLNQLELQSSGYGGIGNIVLDRLIDAKNEYNAHLAELKNLTLDSTSTLYSIERLQIEHLNSYASTFQLVFERLHEWTTWAYVLLSILIDVALIFLVTVLYLQLHDTEAIQAQRTVNFPEKYRSDPRFIWTPPEKLSR